MFTFAIVGAKGNLVADNRWMTDGVDVSLTPYGQTSVVVNSDKPRYAVCGGSSNDFKSLKTSGAVPSGETQALTVRSKVQTSGNVRVWLLLLEYDSAGRRLGEIRVKPNTESFVTLRAGTSYVLLALRFRGRGEVTFSSLDGHHSPAYPTKPGPSVEETSDGREGSKTGSEEEVRGLVSDFAARALTLKAKLDELDLAPVATPVTRNARDDGSISAARERLVHSALEAMAGSLPSSNGTHHFEPINARVGIVTDEYMFNFYKDVFAEVQYLSPENWQAETETGSLDAFFYVTGWKGMNDEEWKGVKFREKPMRALDEILEHFRSRGLPTVFQSIEDPPNFDYFLPVAAKFDYVFTSDTSCVSRYKEDLGHDRVFYGEYGANPLVNNPIGSARFDLKRSVFAGSYPERYADRVEDMGTIFDSFEDSAEQLLIIDRNFGTEDFQFPSRYQSSIVGAFDHATLQRIHKLFRYSLNFNSVKDSPTMCAMRVYELQAQGKPLISNYANSVFNKFPEVRIIPQRTTIHGLDEAKPDHSESAMAQRSLHRIMHDKTSFDVVSEMAETIGLPRVRRRSEKVLVFGVGDESTVVASLARQRLARFDVEFDADRLRQRLATNEYGYLARVDAQIEYGPFYLVSRVNAFKYADITFATQKAEFVNGQYVPGDVHEYTATANRSEHTVVSTAHEGGLDFVLGLSTELAGDGYAVDPYEVGYRRFTREQEYSRASEKGPRLSVIVPVYNNGRFLETKCIPSLKRNLVWQQMEVILVDDGSTDLETRAICEDLVAMYPNVRSVSFDDGGSGSASRPRNEGVRLARGELIAYLDPDNEISPGGYDALVSQFDHLASQGSRPDLVSGYQVKVGAKTSVTGRHSSDGIKLVDDPRAVFFEAGKFPVVSTQAAVIRAGFLKEFDIRFVENAAGQDTLYGWEVIARAERVAFTDAAFLIYYAERADSVTNRVDLKFFEKSLVMERSQVPILASLNLLDLYKNYHLQSFVRNWYLERLTRVDAHEYPRARAIVSEIVSAYGSVLSDYELEDADLQPGPDCKEGT